MEDARSDAGPVGVVVMMRCFLDGEALAGQGVVTMRFQRTANGGESLGSGDGAFSQIGEGIEKGADEHVAGDAAQGVEMDVLQGFRPGARERRKNVLF
jgi:hypothetical protein